MKGRRQHTRHTHLWVAIVPRFALTFATVLLSKPSDGTGLASTAEQATKRVRRPMTTMSDSSERADKRKGGQKPHGGQHTRVLYRR